MDLMDEQRYFISMAFAVVAMDLLYVVADELNEILTPFQCVVDVCNRFGKPQYCNDDRCLNCEDIKQKCGTWQMPANCSNFCWEYQTKEFIARTCPPPWNISNGHVNVSSTSYGRYLSGAPLSFDCNEGYVIQGNTTFICSDKGQWSPETSAPFCTPLSLSAAAASSQSALIAVLVVVIGILVVVIVGLVIYYCLCCKRKRTSADTRTPSKNNSSESLETKDEGIPLVRPVVNGNVQNVVFNLNVCDRAEVPSDTEHDKYDSYESGTTAAGENTDLKTGIETPVMPMRELDSAMDLSHNDVEDKTKFPVQVEHVDKTKDKGTSPLSPRNDQNNAVCEESGAPGNKRKMALGNNTVCNSDIATNSNGML